MLLNSIENKEKILQEFLQIAAFEGWNKESLLQALDKCKIGREFCPIIFENDILDLTEFYINSQNQKFCDEISKIKDFHQDKIRNKIRLCLYKRFEIEAQNKLALQRMVNFYQNPKNFLQFEIGARPLLYGLKNCYQIADLMWKTINDSSTDFNYYTKRITLGKIILRSLQSFLQDESNNLEKTKNFIDLEIEKVMKFEKFKGRVKQVSKKVKDGFGHFILDENGLIKSPKDLIKDLPFIRLFKK